MANETETKQYNTSAERKMLGDLKRFNWFYYILFFIILTIFNRYNSFFCKNDRCSNTHLFIGDCLETFCSVLIIVMVLGLVMNAKIDLIEIEDLKKRIEALEPKSQV